MSLEIERLIACAELQAELDHDEYVQQYLARSFGPPEAYKGRQTQQKLDEILKKCAVSFVGRSFLDLGCNKGFFPLYAGAVGAIRSIGIDPDQTRVSRANAIARLSHNLAQFFCDKFRIAMVEQYGIFDVLYVGSAYHYFWLAHRPSRSAKDHEEIFASLASMTAEVLIFEGCISLDDEPWRRAAIKSTGLPESELRAEYNGEVILNAAKRFFDIKALGSAGHAPHRLLFTMERKASKLVKVSKFQESSVIKVVDKAARDSANKLESVAVLTTGEEKYIRKILSNKRAWCGPAISFFQRSLEQMPYPRGLVRHYAMTSNKEIITLYQQYLPEDYKPLNGIRARDLRMRQRLLHSVLSMERDLLTAGLLHMDIHETNIFVSDNDVRIIDFEGLILVDTNLYREKFSQFYTLNFIALLELCFGTGVRRSDLQPPASTMYGSTMSAEEIEYLLSAVRCRSGDVIELYKQILSRPFLLQSIELYDTLLRGLPRMIGATTAPA